MGKLCWIRGTKKPLTAHSKHKKANTVFGWQFNSCYYQQLGAAICLMLQNKLTKQDCAHLTEASVTGKLQPGWAWVCYIQMRPGWWDVTMECTALLGAHCCCFLLALDRDDHTRLASEKLASLGKTIATAGSSNKKVMKSSSSKWLLWWLGGSVVRALDSGPRDREFDSQPVRYQVTTLALSAK